MDTGQLNLFFLRILETTRRNIGKIRSVAECCGDMPTRKLLFELYEQQMESAEVIERQAGLISSQAEKSAEDLTRAYDNVRKNEDELAAANDQLRKYAVDLRTTIASLRATNRELEDAYYDTIRRLVVAAEYKDPETGSHITRISRYSALLAEKMGLPPEEVRIIMYASPMHDIGKIGIPDKILLKNDVLLEPEQEIMRLHTLIGSNILADSKSKVLQCAQQIALFHHEKWNGKGYPQAVAEKEIPLPARIVTLADTFDALVSARPYKKAFPVEKSCEIIRNERGSHFDPEVVDSFFENLDDILKIRSEVISSPDQRNDFGMLNSNN
jgi:putative two-component system response regulator